MLEAGSGALDRLLAELGVAAEIVRTQAQLVAAAP